MPRRSIPLNKVIPRKYAVLCLALTASAFGFLAPLHPPINQTALAHVQPENQQAQLPATQTQQNAQAAAVLQTQESLIAAVRNPQLDPAKYRTWLKQTQAEHEKTLALSENLRLTLFPTPPVSRNSQGHFLNNYKLERDLSPAEREAAYAQERQVYLAKPLGTPQPFDLKAWNAGPAEQGYDFVLLPTGEVRLSPIEMRDSEIEKETGKWPNHTLLAEGGPVQTAGNLFLFQQDGKRVLFLANKSGHYLPDYASLQLIRQHLIQAGIPGEEIYLLSMGGYYANVAYKFFYAQQIDFQQPALSPNALHQQYLENWRKNWQSLNLKAVLTELIAHPEKPLSAAQFKALKTMRKQALYLGSVYFLMDQRHSPPAAFENYVNEFGLLMDAVAAQQPATIYSRALSLQAVLNAQNMDSTVQDFEPVSRADLQADLNRRAALIRQTLAPESISVHEMHLMRIEFKHLLFLYMTLSQSQPERLLPELIRFHLQAITDHLGDLHDLAVQADLNGQAAYAEAQLRLEPKLKKYLQQTLERSLAQRF
jgi:CHAD domain-containing protein